LRNASQKLIIVAFPEIFRTLTRRRARRCLVIGPNSVSSKLVINGLQKTFVVNEGFGHSRHVHAIENVNLEIADGEFVCVIGPSGCGKSTMLMIMAGLYPKSGGDILLDGQPLSEPGPRWAWACESSTPWSRSTAR
jgi:ABC-type glutathione transport system ATPase component